MMRLVNIKLRIEYATISTGKPFEEAIELDVANFKIADTQPDDSTRSKMVLGLEKVAGSSVYLLNRRLPDLEVNFDTNSNISNLFGSLKIIITTQSDTGTPFIDTAFYPILPENDSTFSDAADIAGVLLHAYLLRETSQGNPQWNLFFVSEGGGGVTTDCAGCHDTPPRDKRVSCALDGCYLSETE